MFVKYGFVTSSVVNCQVILFVFPVVSSPYAYTFTLLHSANGVLRFTCTFQPLLEEFKLPPYPACNIPLLNAVLPSIRTIILCDTIETLSNILNTIFSFVATPTALFVGDKFTKYGGVVSILTIFVLPHAPQFPSLSCALTRHQLLPSVKLFIV